MAVELIFVEAHIPKLAPVLAGFVLLDQQHGLCRYSVRFLRDWSFVPEESDREVLAEMESHVRDLFIDDPKAAIRILGEASNVLRCSERLQLPLVSTDDLEELAHQLFKLLLAGR